LWNSGDRGRLGFLDVYVFVARPLASIFCQGLVYHV
jgi:hypothetical protein